MPPTPWFKSDPLIERPLIGQDIPLLGDRNKELIEKNFLPGRKPKALALSSSGVFADYIGQDSTDEAARRALEVCGGIAGLACMIVAVDDNFVVPVPTMMKPVGFFHPAGATVIAPELRDNVAHRLANAGGWTAVAAGDSGKVGSRSSRKRTGRARRCHERLQQTGPRLPRDRDRSIRRGTEITNITS